MERYQLGFTGTREGMSIAQTAIVSRFLEHSSITKAHHGDCAGSDANFHQLCQLFNIELIIHPPIIDLYRAFCQGFSEIKDCKDYLERDRDIVDESDRLMATPKGYIEQPRSGTWYTINYARKQGKPILIIWPNGFVNVEGKWNG